MNDEKLEMEGEENTLSSAKVEEEEEPIGSLFKVKKSKKFKSVANIQNDNFGEMEDTLACFWKKLKGKKDVETPTCTPDFGLEESKPKSRPKRSRVSGLSKKMKNHLELGDLNEAPKAQKKLKKKLKEEALQSCIYSSDENLDFSLSAFLRKSQSSLGKKPRSSSAQKKKKRKKNSVDDFARGDDVALERVPSGFMKGSCSASAVSGVVSVEPQGWSDLALGGTTKETATLQVAAGTQTSYDKPCKISSYIQDGMVSEQLQEEMCLPKSAAEALRYNNDRCSQRIPKENIPISPLRRCYAGSTTDLRENHSIPNNDEVNRSTTMANEVGFDALNQPCGSGPVNIRSQQVQQCRYASNQRFMGETKELIDGSMQCSHSKENKISENDSDVISKISEGHLYTDSAVRDVNANSCGVLVEPSDAMYSTKVCYSSEARESLDFSVMQREDTLIPGFGDMLNRPSDGNSSDKQKNFTCNSVAALDELSSKKSSSTPSKSKAELTVRLEELANAENKLMNTLPKSSMVCVSAKPEEAAKLQGFDKCLHGNVKAHYPELPPRAPLGRHVGDSRVPSNNTVNAFVDRGLNQMEVASKDNDRSPGTNASFDNIRDNFRDVHKEARTTVDVHITNHLSDSSIPVHDSSPQNRESLLASKGAHVPKQDCLPSEEKVNPTCSYSIKLEPNNTSAQEAPTASDLEYKNENLKAMQRAARKVKRRRHGDMAYEEDIDWEFLMHAQGVFEDRDIFNGDRPSRENGKSGYSNMVVGAENCDAAAVAAGLKARAACPFEKIKFKEILKRRGGLQEYLDCRNLILGLWSKDTSHILLLSDCGVTDELSDNDPPRAALIREIYEFLDHNGYINVGIASEKGKEEQYADTFHKVCNEREIEDDSGALAVVSDDGVPLMVGHAEDPARFSETENDVSFKNDISHATKSTEPLPSMGFERCLISSEEPYICSEEKNGWINTNQPNRTAEIDALTKLSSQVVHGGQDLDVVPEKITDSQMMQSVILDPVEGYSCKRSDTKVPKRVIIIGAGPAGLTAGRHLQRQGFSVTILEARNRLGGRVYTDHSSLSVPVDLGASIITGVEADVATERRPDPSSLVCSQLGLELSVLNSDCPLYDTVTGQKVPPELDEALEAEYNSLLDDMVVLVEQKGDSALKMSLEDGLEYALTKRCVDGTMPHAEEEVDNLVNASIDTGADGQEKNPSRISSEESLSPFERRVMNWHFAHLEYGCAAPLKDVSLPNWNQDDLYGGFGGAHCMIKGGYSNVIESLGEGLTICLNHIVTEISYSTVGSGETNGSEVKVSTSNGSDFLGDAVLITVPLGCLKANTIRFSPSLPNWKQSSISQLGFGVLNKVVLEFPAVFWDDTMDYFGATAEETDRRGQCFMFWNVKKTVGAPVLIALVVGKAAVDGESMSATDHVDHALKVLRKLFGTASVPDPVASVVTNWGQDPFSRGAYSYVAVGASGEDYDILGRPVENCLFFAGEATCKEHPDTVGGAMMSGLREAVRIIDILNTGKDYTAEVEAMEAALRQTETERNEVRDILNRLEAVKLSSALYKSSYVALLHDMFRNAKTTKGRLHLAKVFLNLPVDDLKSFAGTREGLSILNSWILDSMGKDGTQLLRHCVRLLVLVSTDLLAVRLSGIGRTVKEKVCVHTSRDIRAVASQLISVWIDVFRKKKAANGGSKLSRQTTLPESSKSKSSKSSIPVKNTRPAHGATYHKGNLQDPSSPKNKSNRKTNSNIISSDTGIDLKSEGNSLHSQDIRDSDSKTEEGDVVSEEEAAAFAAAEAARAAALAAAEAYASSEAERNALRDLPKIPSFHKFARREQYAEMDEVDFGKRWSGGVLGRQDCLSEIDSRNCKVLNWSVDFSAACANLENSRMSGDNYTQKSESNEIGYQVNQMREHSGESAAVDNRLTQAWVDSAGSGGIKDYQDIERWQSQAEAIDPDFFHHTVNIRDEEDSSAASKPVSRRYDKGTEGSAASENQARGVERIKKAVVDYVGSLLMPLYKARKIDRDGYKSIMKKSATKVMEQTTDAEKAMNASQFLDFKRKNKIRAFVDKLIEKHMAMNPVKL
ncbi:hypothetical protein ACHQM5_024722 [Ranunculus cassubicifolius]